MQLKEVSHLSEATDWRCNFQALFSQKPFRFKGPSYDLFYEVPGADVLCCLFCVEETRMNTYTGRLAFFKDKQQPKFLLDLSSCFRCYAWIFEDENSKLYFYVTYSLAHAQEVEEAVLIVDVKSEKLGYIKPPADTEQHYDSLKHLISCWVNGLPASLNFRFDELKKLKQELLQEKR